MLPRRGWRLDDGCMKFSVGLSPRGDALRRDVSEVGWVDHFRETPADTEAVDGKV